MIVFDYSDIRARMDRREQTSSCPMASGGFVTVSCGSGGSGGGGKVAVTKTVNITVNAGVNADAFISRRTRIARILASC